MTDIVKRLCDPSKGSPRWQDTMFEAANEIERLRAEVARCEASILAWVEAVGECNKDRHRLRAERDAAYKIGGEEALLHALHPEFGSIYDADGEATVAYKAGRREGIEAAAKLADGEWCCECPQMLDIGEVCCRAPLRVCDTALPSRIRALLEDGR